MRVGLAWLLIAILAGCVSTSGAPRDGVTCGRADDTAEIQAAIDSEVHGGTVQLPAATCHVSALTGAANVAIQGAGRTSTTIAALTNDRTLLTITGTRKGGGSIVELQTASSVSGIAFDAAGHSGDTGIAYIGVSYFTLSSSSFTGFAVGVLQHGSLQSEVHDAKFVDNLTGLKYESAQIGYMNGPVPPNRVLVSWSAFYGNTLHAIDYGGGAQLLVEDSEFGGNGTAGDDTTSAIVFREDPYNNATAQGLVLRGGWFEGSLGYAAIELQAQTTAHSHAITDTFFPTNDARYAVAAGAGNTVVLDRVLIADAAASREVHGPVIVRR